MLRIFGYYNLGHCDNSVISRMNETFNIESVFTDYMTFNQKNVSLIYESFKKDEAANFYFSDKNRPLACFVVGNIHAYENSSLKVLTGKNIAKFVINEYLKGGLEFVQYLSGTFNIVLIDKDQVFLINDNFGLSPMYIYHTDNGFFFCNEADVITWLDIDNRLDHSSIAEFLVYGFVPDGKTFIRGLYNQSPGTIVKFCDKKVSTEKYYDFKPMNVSGMSEGEKIKSVHDLFQESVQIRTNESGEDVFSDLTGGWDTRFVLANLTRLSKKVIAYTSNHNLEDLEIAKLITDKLNLEHLVDAFPFDVNSQPQIFLDKLYARRQVRCLYHKHKDFFHDYYKHWIDCSYFTLPKFRGLFGTELLGNVPDWYDKRTKLNLVVSGDKIFDRKFLKKALNYKNHEELLHPFDKSVSNQYLFLTQIGRSYLNALNSGWERPTSFFHYRASMPFTDSKFVSLLSALEYDMYFGYRMYEILYKKYYSSYFNFPWTHFPGRKESDLNQSLSIKPEAKIDDNTLQDSGFVSFLKRQTFVKGGEAALSRSRELFLLYNWLDIYKTVLDPLDVNLFSGEMISL